MRNRLRSIEWKFPAWITAVVLLATVVFVWSGYQRLAAVVDEAAGNQLLASARLVSGMLDDGYEAARLRLAGLAGERSSVAALTGPRAPADRLRPLPAGAPADSTLRGRWIVGTDGTVRAASVDAVTRPLWAASELAAGRGLAEGLAISPILEHAGEALFELAVPVRGSTGGPSSAPLGYVVEARAVRGRGVDQVRGLAGTSTLLVGQPGAGVWTDLAGVAPAPPALAPGDSIFRFDDSPWGAGVGAARPIAGTPWVVWLGRPRAAVRAPLQAWLRGVVPLATLVILASAAIAWSVTRRITSRLVTLSRRMDALELGESAPQARLAAGPDELGRLEHSFQHLLERARSHKALEDRLAASQKLEAVGRLAGGIAHDFNNMLTVVSNYGEMVRADLPPGSAAEKDMDEVLRAAERAARLTRQLLTFSGRRVVAPQALDLNVIIRDAQRMLERLIPERVRFSWELDPRIGPIRADPGQIEQVLLNLAQNASDAMPDGGDLTIRTSRAVLDDAAAPGPNEGDGARSIELAHVCLSVRDTGIGMDRETTKRIFEPFFTTKPSGKGTGLGLPTVHGIVTQLGGRIWVYSEPGQGTTFKVYFPESRGVAEPLPVRPRPSPLVRGDGGTILLVEDDPAARQVTQRLLERAGYQVIAAEDGGAALERLEVPGVRVDLVLSDVVMPGMGGADLAERLGGLRPGLPVILMSGYNDLPASTWGASGNTRTLLEKPFSSMALLDAVRIALTSPPPGSAPPPAAPR